MEFCFGFDKIEEDWIRLEKYRISKEFISSLAKGRAMQISLKNEGSLKIFERRPKYQYTFRIVCKLVSYTFAWVSREIRREIIK